MGKIEFQSATQKINHIIITQYGFRKGKFLELWTNTLNNIFKYISKSFKEMESELKSTRDITIMEGVCQDYFRLSELFMVYLEQIFHETSVTVEVGIKRG